MQLQPWGSHKRRSPTGLSTNKVVKYHLSLLLFSPGSRSATSAGHRCLQRSRQLPGCTRRGRTSPAGGEETCSCPAGKARTTPWCSWPQSSGCWSRWHRAWCAERRNTETLAWEDTGEESCAAAFLLILSNAAAPQLPQCCYFGSFRKYESEIQSSFVPIQTLHQLKAAERNIWNRNIKDRRTYKLPQHISVFELPHRRLQPVDRDDVAVSYGGKASIAVSGGAEGVESFTVWVRRRSLVKAPDENRRNEERRVIITSLWIHLTATSTATKIISKLQKNWDFFFTHFQEPTMSQF